MSPGLLLTGSLIGLSISMPMGPIGMLCLRYSLSRGKSFGIASGLGVALADSICGAVAGICLTALTTFIENNQSWLQLIGSFFLFYFGVANLLRAERKMEKTEVVGAGHIKVFLLMFLITLSNPLTLLSFVGMYAAVGLQKLEGDILAIMILSLGVFAGSSTWWLLLSSGSSFIGRKISRSLTAFINRTVGLGIIGFSLFTFYTSVKNIF